MDEKTVITHLMDIKNQLTENTLITKATEEQAKKTNGRVSKLEEHTISIDKILAEQLHINSKLDGAILAHKQWMEEKIKSSREFHDREINELKKKIDKDTKFHTTETKEKNKTIREVVKHAITAGITLIASLTIGK